MPGKKWSLVVLVILIAASSTYTFSQAAIQNRKLPVSALHKMKATHDHGTADLSKYGPAKPTQRRCDFSGKSHASLTLQ